MGVTCGPEHPGMWSQGSDLNCFLSVSDVYSELSTRYLITQKACLHSLRGYCGGPISVFNLGWIESCSPLSLILITIWCMKCLALIAILHESKFIWHPLELVWKAIAHFSLKASTSISAMIHDMTNSMLMKTDRYKTHAPFSSALTWASMGNKSIGRVRYTW